MKTFLRSGALMCAFLFTSTISIFAQGSLTPPGAPAPTMKTLDQLDAKLEPRTPISSLPFTINAPGSYYLTKNLNITTGDAITISANQVTLDLNGFTISSTASPAAGAGIRLDHATDITILNGHIQGGVSFSGGSYSGPGFQDGISYFNTPFNVLVERVSVSGCLSRGIFLGGAHSTVVESCRVQTVGSSGIVAPRVSHSTAYQCGSFGIFANDAASDCYGQSTASDAGIYATNIADNCYGQSSSGTGLSAFTANHCYGSTNGSGAYYGLYAINANNCYGQSSSNYGLYANTANNCYGQSSSGTGLNAYAANNCYGYGTTSPTVGLSANIANNCYGVGGSYGLNAEIAIGCYGQSTGTGGVGLNAYIANSCAGTSVTYTYHYNMPP